MSMIILPRDPPTCVKGNLTTGNLLITIIFNQKLQKRVNCWNKFPPIREYVTNKSDTRHLMKLNRKVTKFINLKFPSKILKIVKKLLEKTGVRWLLCTFYKNLNFQYLIDTIKRTKEKTRLRRRISSVWVMLFVTQNIITWYNEMLSE